MFNSYSDPLSRFDLSAVTTFWRLFAGRNKRLKQLRARGGPINIYLLNPRGSRHRFPSSLHMTFLNGGSTAYKVLPSRRLEPSPRDPLCPSSRSRPAGGQSPGTPTPAGCPGSSSAPRLRRARRNPAHGDSAGGTHWASGLGP